MYNRSSGNSPCRDISWHPYFPVIASTEFNGNVNVWTLQSLKTDEVKLLDEEDEK